ncbi:MAG: hypothetical protein R3180_00055 [Marinobacter sp.]|nr:hypothetical protein [Marinobacter sp.]
MSNYENTVVVIIGPQGCGKSRSGPALQIAYNCDYLSHELPAKLPETGRCLVLCNDKAIAEHWAKKQSTTRSFIFTNFSQAQEVLREAARNTVGGHK